MRGIVRARAAIAVVGLSMLIALLGAPTANATTQLTATGRTAVRTVASATGRVLGTLDPGQTVTATNVGKTWASVRFAGGRGYVARAALTTKSKVTLATVVPAGSLRVASTAINVRTGAGTSFRVLTVLRDGSRVTMTGRSSRGFGEVIQGSTRGWASLRYLIRVRGGLPGTVGERVATAALNIRTSDGASSRTIAEVPKGTVLPITGVVSHARAQVIYRNTARWVTAKYLAERVADLPPAPGLPKITGYRYATAVLNIRSTYKDRYTLIAEVPVGTRLPITGVVRNGRMQVVWQNAARWVTAKYLSKTVPAPAPPPGSYAVEKGLKPNAIKVHRALRARYPQITTYYGVRPDPIPDHPSGRALDAMIPNYKSASGKALGYDVAGWLKDNARSLGIQYIIWNQHIWNIQRDAEGWRYMADRGGDSANHKNHVHITVYP